MNGRLVRSLVQKRMKAQGVENEFRTAPPEEYRVLLETKLMEEVLELLRDTTNVEEMADVVEVILHLMTLHGIQPEAVDTVRRAKLQTHGGFASRLVLLGPAKLPEQHTYDPDRYCSICSSGVRGRGCEL